VLEVSPDLVPSTQVEKKGEWVNVESSPNEYSELIGGSRSF